MDKIDMADTQLLSTFIPRNNPFSDFVSYLKGSISSWNVQAQAVSRVAEESSQNISIRGGELLTKIIATLITLGISGTVTFFLMKWLMKHLDPTNKDKEEQQKRAEKLMNTIGIRNVKLTEYELCVAANLVDPLSFTVDWNDIGGLDDIATELKETVILPFKRQNLFASSKLLRAPKGVLLYGPPGCGKTMLAKATAKAAGARFINLQVSSLVDKWYGESQKRAEAVFSLAMKLQPTIIFIDELDTFLRNRTTNDHEATAMIKTQFMSWWDGIMTDDSCQIIIMGATNRPQDVDAAILRRMPSMFYVGVPNMEQRKQILDIILSGEHMDTSVNISKLAEQTEGFCGSDLQELCRNAAIYKIREFLEEERQSGCRGEPNLYENPNLRALNMQDFNSALSKMKKGKYTNNMPQIDLD